MTTAAASGLAAPGRKKSRPGAVRVSLLRLLPLLPTVLLLAAFMAGPIVYSLVGSFTNRSLTGPKAEKPEFIGFANYAELFSSPDFWNSVLLTIVFILASAVIGQNVLGMGLAVVIRSAAKPLSSLVGGLVVLAWVLPEIVAAFALYAFFSKDGTLNAMLGWFGLEGSSWLYYFPMLTVIIANIWRGTAFSMMVYNAALSEVPPELTEAATIDGAGAWQRFTQITLPYIRRSISTNLLLTTLQTLGVFTLIWVMTGGGPGTSSATLPVLAFQEAFKFAQVGYGTAIATVTLLIGAIFSIVYIKLLKPEVD